MENYNFENENSPVLPKLIKTLVVLGMVGAGISAICYFSIGMEIWTDLKINPLIAANFGDLLFTVAEAILLYFVVSKLKAMDINTPNSFLIFSFIAISILTSLFAFSESLDDLNLVLFLIYLIVGLITFILFLKNQPTRGIGIWWLISVVAVLILAFIEPSSKGAFKVCALIYLAVYFKLLEAYQNFLIGKSSEK